MDTNDTWSDMLDFPGATGIVNYLEAYVPLMNFQGCKVIAPSSMGHIWDTTEAALHGTTFTGPWKLTSDTSADTLLNELSVNGLLRFDSVPWWSSIPQGDLEWSIELYPGSYIALLPTMSNEYIANLMRHGLCKRTMRLREYVADMRESYQSQQVSYSNLDSTAPVHIVEYGITRGWATGVDIYTNPQYKLSERRYGELMAQTIQQVSNLSCASTASLYDLENRSAAYDAVTGYAESYGLMKSTGELSFAADAIAGVLGGSIDTADDSPTGSWWSEGIDTGLPVTPG